MEKCYKTLNVIVRCFFFSFAQYNFCALSPQVTLFIESNFRSFDDFFPKKLRIFEEISKVMPSEEQIIFVLM